MNDLLRFDGLYRHLRPGGHCAWFRFYADGVAVCAQTSPQSYAQVATWLNQAQQTHCPWSWSEEEEGVLDLELRIPHPTDGTVSSFARTIHVGEATIADQAADAHKHSRATVEQYTFLALPAAQLDPSSPGRFNRISYAKLLKLGIPQAHIDLLQRGPMSVKVMQSATAAEISAANALSEKVAAQIVAWRDGQA